VRPFAPSDGRFTHDWLRCLATPCHTQDSICYYVTDRSLPGATPVVFTGDTLFVGGCGRFFEGDGAQMHAALTYLGTLPDPTLVYSGHEYTAGNLSFAKSIDPDNKALTRLQELVDSHKVTQGYGTIGDEKEWNVFMRLGTDAVRCVCFSVSTGCGISIRITSLAAKPQTSPPSPRSWMNSVI